MNNTTAKNEFDYKHSNGIYIPHFSPSTVSNFIENRWGFWNSKVLRTPFKGNHHTSLGQAVEHGVNIYLENPEKQLDYLAHANEKYDDQIRDTGTPRDKVTEYRNMIPGMLELALRHYKRTFAETGAVTQHKIETQLEGVERTMLGYLDFLVTDKQVRDSKVVGRSPSKLKQAYVLQGAVYRHATGLPVFFDFFITNKTPTHKEIELSDEEFEFGISYITRAAAVLEELEECENPKRVFELMSFPNLEAFYSDGEMRQAAKAWGIAIPLGYGMK